MITCTERSSSVGQWFFYSKPPHPRLTPYVMGLYAFEGVMRPDPGHGIGGPCAELMISLDGWVEFRDRGAGGNDVFRTHDPFVSGLRETSKAYRLEPGFTGMQVDLTPLGARMVFNAPMSLVTNVEVDAAEFFGRSLEPLRQSLLREQGWSRRFEILERFLGDRIERASSPDPVVLEAWPALVASRGQLRIETLRQDLRIGQRRMSNVFQDQIGLTPKRLAQLVRFDYALTLATGHREMAWSELAYRSGFYDQAHMINDFRRRTGLTPPEVRRLLLPQVSMAGTDVLGALYVGKQGDG